MGNREHFFRKFFVISPTFSQNRPITIVSNITALRQLGAIGERLHSEYLS
jgi:hypothetical protein